CIRKEKVSRRRFYGTGGDGSNINVEEAENEQEWTMERMKNCYYSRIYDQSKCEEVEEQHTPGHNKCCMSEEEVSRRGMLRHKYYGSNTYPSYCNLKFYVCGA
nr:hypothetical protein [Tanacetum cinerariifolium]